MTKPVCIRCGGSPVLSSDLCGPCFAHVHGVPWAVCAECVVEGLTNIADRGGGYWHIDCAAFALSVIAKPQSACRRCQNARPGDEAIVDFQDRKWCLHCAAEALARLRVARDGLTRFRGDKRKT